MHYALCPTSTTIWSLPNVCVYSMGQSGLMCSNCVCMCVCAQRWHWEWGKHAAERNGTLGATIMYGHVGEHGLDKHNQKKNRFSTFRADVIDCLQDWQISTEVIAGNDACVGERIIGTRVWDQTILYVRMGVGNTHLGTHFWAESADNHNVSINIIDIIGISLLFATH